MHYTSVCCFFEYIFTFGYIFTLYFITERMFCKVLFAAAECNNALRYCACHLLLIRFIRELFSFFRIRKETAFHDHCRHLYMAQQIDPLISLLVFAFVLGLYLRHDTASYGFCQHSTVRMISGIEHLRAAVLALFKKVLMDTDQNAAIGFIYILCAILYVGPLPLSNRRQCSIPHRSIRLANHLHCDSGFLQAVPHV